VYSKATIIECQADWLTLTCHDPDRAATFRAWANHLLGYEQHEGNQRRPFGLRGYVGAIAGRVRHGSREDGDLVMLSGDIAQLELERGMALADNCSRIDLAVTVRQEPFDTDLERASYEAYLLSPTHEGRRARARLVQSDDAGATFYLGSRDSDVMLRLYNKQAESGDPHYRACHRYELELKGERAGLVATEYARTLAQPEYVQSVMTDYCRNRGVAPIFPACEGIALVPGFRRRSDVESSLLWLERQVQPTVRRLRDFGRGEDARTALWGKYVNEFDACNVVVAADAPEDGARGDGS